MQELAVVQQQAEMYQAQLGDLDAAYDQLMGECHALRAAAQCSSRCMVESASRHAAIHRTRPASRPEPSTAEPGITACAGPRASGSAGHKEADLIQLDSGPGEETAPDGSLAATLAEGTQPVFLPQLEEAAVDGQVDSAGQGGALDNSVVQLKARVHDLQAQLGMVIQDRDTILVGIGDIEQAAANRLEKMEQERQELQSARAAATIVAAEAAEAQQTCYEQAAEIGKLRSVISELQAVVEDARQGAEQQEKQIADLQEAVKAQEATCMAEGKDGRGHVGEAAHAKAALAAALVREEALQKQAADASAAVATLSEAHTAELAGLREDSLGKLEDVRAEARELVKKGTADLQQALKGAQAQLQVCFSLTS